MTAFFGHGIIRVMPNYRRAFQPGGTFFFTVVTCDRRPILCTEAARPILRAAISNCKALYPFTIGAFVLLPDHLHAIWTLPETDSGFSRRWGVIKLQFTKAWRDAGGDEQPVSIGKDHQRRAGVWQPRFMEHLIRDADDFNAHVDYVHYNPVKHGYAACPHVWPYSSFHRWVRDGYYETDWNCCCNKTQLKPPNFKGLDGSRME